MTSSEIGLYLLSEKYSSSNYIFGYTYNFDKTHQLIDKTLSDLVISCHLIIKFYDSNAMKQFINILEKDLEIIIYDDTFFSTQEKKNFIIPDNYLDIPMKEIKDLLNSKIIYLKSNLKRDKNYQDIDSNNLYELIENRSISNEDRYSEFRKHKPSRGDGDSKYHLRRSIENCTYLYVVGEPDSYEGLHTLKVGIAKNLNHRLYDYQTHSPNKVNLYFSQSCYGDNAEKIEKRVHRIIRTDHRMLHQDWCRMVLDDLENVIKRVMQEFHQPEYEVITYGDNDSEIFLTFGSSFLHIYRDFIHPNSKSDEGLSGNFYVLALLENRYGTYDERKKNGKKLKEFENLNSCYEYLYKEVFIKK